MSRPISNKPDEGKRVWCFKEIRGTSPDTKKRVHVPADTGGTICYTHASSPLGIGKALVVVRWDSGQETDTGFANILCIHPFRTLDDLLEAAVTASGADYILGSENELEGFRIEVWIGENLETLFFPKEQHAFFQDFLIPRVKISVNIGETKWEKPEYLDEDEA